ncbi:MAG: chromosome segregation protein SMC [Clostridiales Family XIII bacterium]|jgi:chromosome segregation protein|nr:chromosome segregation protein SMC [Clostridiales Family XIII bacterium]
MYLKRIEIQGFKSFAEPVSIEFDSGITCIIGPNGSGKSNISDAMRWVLGEQSAKTLRGGKMEEIIFAGTDSRRSKGMAEVTLVLDNTSGLLGIEYAEVAIRRRLFRSGESEYFINGNQCRLKDIRELIMDTGIGVDGYSFIGQGRVDKIVSDKPETRREVFEEAAGIIKYKSKRAEAQRKLESASGNLDRINDIVIDIESRIDGLKEESEKAQEYAELSKRYKELEINITLKNIENLQGKNRELTEQFTEAEKRLAELRGSKIKTDAELSSLRARNDELFLRSSELKDRHTENVTKALNIRNAALLTEEKKKSIERDRIRLTAESEELAAKIEADRARLEELTSDKEGLSAELGKLNSKMVDLLSVQAEKEGVYSQKSLRIDELKAKMFELSRSKALKEAELAGNRELLGTFDSAEENLKSELSSAGEAFSSAEAETADLRLKKTALSEKIGNLQAELASVRERYEKDSSAISDLRNRIEELKLSASNLSSRQKTIEEMEANYEGYNGAVRALMKSKPSAGIYGVVAELMKVNKGFEIAIETALGQTMQNIICEDDGDAKKGIEFLKKNSAGRLTFLPVKSIRARDARADKGLEGAKGFLGYAIDQIDFGDKYSEIYSYLLGKIVISDTLDNAIAMSKNNRESYRIVTVDGDVINPAGALTGGRYKNKSANLLERKNESETLKAKVEEIYAQGRAAKSELEALIEKNSSDIEKIRELDASVRENETEAVRADGEISAAEFRHKTLFEQIEKARNSLKSIETDRADSSGMNESLAADIRLADEKLASITSEIEETMASLPVAKAASVAATEDVTELRLKLGRQESAKGSAEQAVLSLEEGISSSEKLLLSKREELAEVLGFGLSETSGSIEDLTIIEEENEKLEGEIETVLTERNQILLTIKERELEDESFEAKIEAQISTKNGMEVELGRQDTRLTTWKERLFDEFELSYVHALEFKKDDFVMTSGIKENRVIKDRLREIGEVNPGSIKDYAETSERYNFLTEQRDDVLSSMRDFQEIVRDMDNISKAKFKESFDNVSETFRETFTVLFGGGVGEISLEDETNPLESGIEIKVRPPGKSNLASINGYSGGEKAMIAIALLFSILKAKPTPFCMLDEIDAALDETNIHSFADYIASFKDTQFALVTHQRSTMEYADVLFGVTMQEKGVTSILSLALGESETEEFAEKLEA